MFEKYGSINIQGKDIEIDKLSVEEIKQYLEIVNDKERQIIKAQNEYLSQLIG